MTVCHVYIGDLHDPKFKWDGGDWNGNTPAALSDNFPPMRNHYNGDFHDWVNTTQIQCKQTDYGAHVAKISKAEIRKFIIYAYKGQEELTWIKQQLPSLLDFVNTLDDQGVYGLVATEF